MHGDRHHLLPLENLVWRVAQLAAAQLSPFGTVAVRIAYVARQLAVVADGLDSGEGFEITVTLAEVVPGVEVDLRWELRKDRPIARLGVRIDLQFFHQWFDQLDVGRKSTAEKEPKDGTAASVDPWEPWLNALGEALITDLAATLGTRTAILPDDGRASAILQRPDTSETPEGRPDQGIKWVERQKLRSVGPQPQAEDPGSQSTNPGRGVEQAPSVLGSTDKELENEQSSSQHFYSNELDPEERYPRNSAPDAEDERYRGH